MDGKGGVSKEGQVGRRMEKDGWRRLGGEGRIEK